MEAAEVYGEKYAEKYRLAYIESWPFKHMLNVQKLTGILDGLPTNPLWVDLACGPAWHFAQFDRPIRRLGVDQSGPQLERARRNNPSVEFRQMSMLDLELAPGSVDLITCFWGAISYLRDEAEHRRMVELALSWLAPGGALYFELLLPEVIQIFNSTAFSAHTGFKVTPRSPDYVAWNYLDYGGVHEMYSPRRELYLELLEPHFSQIEVLQLNPEYIFGHLMATGKF